MNRGGRTSTSRPAAASILLQRVSAATCNARVAALFYTGMGRPPHLLAATLLLAGGLAMPHARAQCPDAPQTLAAMRDCYRVLLVVATTPDDIALRQQLQWLSADAEGLRERDLRVVPLDAAANAIPPALPTVPLGASEAERVQERFGIHQKFTILLIGKDGTEKLRSHQPVALDRIFDLIDSMPMRRQEIRERH